MDFAAELAGLNEAQREAVLHEEGPLLVLAGAGSGKTRVVTFRIARLIRDGVDPAHILALTFTNKAAAEMRERCAALLEGVRGVEGLTVSTFHAFGARFLRGQARHLGRTPGFSLYDDDDQVSVLESVLDEAGLGQGAAPARKVREALDRAKNEGRALRPEDLPPELLAAGAADLGTAYEAHMRRANAFDFGDLILRPAELLEAEPWLAESVRARWPWILVDEFQDTNAAQMRWLRALAPPETRPNLCVVGDDDQAIYAWRGAEVAHILAFPETWREAAVVRLEVNYRSTGHILDAANGVIAHNRDRLGKTLRTVSGPGERLTVRAFATPREEARFVATRIAQLCRDDAQPSDFAVLFRTNALSLDLEEALRASRLPYVTLRGRSFYERAEVRDALAWLRLAVNPDDDVAFRRAVGAPPRGVGTTSLDKLAEAARAAGRSLHAEAHAATLPLRGGAAAGLKSFLQALETAADSLAAGLSPERVGATLLLPLLERFHADARRSEEAAARGENVERLLVALQSWRQEHPGGTLGEWLESVRLVSDQDDFDPARGAIYMMTVHAAKGLEFDCCFLIGMEEGVFPHRRGEDDPAFIEEERRLCYVALTRARRHLALTSCRERRTFNEVRRNRPSRFLAEIPAEHIEPALEPIRPAIAPVRRLGRSLPRPEEADFRDPGWDEADADPDALTLRPGMSVWHAELGRGRVVAVARGLNATATVEFPSIGRRTVVQRFLSPYEERGDDWD